MTAEGAGSNLGRLRREPPPFRRVEVRHVVPLTPRLLRLTLGGAELEGLVVDEPAASVRLLIPSPGVDELVQPTWNGNEFLLPDGSRPVIRTFTPPLMDGDDLEMALDVVVHDGGLVAEWASRASAGAPAAVSGPGRGYTVDPDAPGYLLAGDETALPAVAQLLTAIDSRIPIAVIVEVAHPDARLDLPPHPGAVVQWVERAVDAAPGHALVPAVERAEIAPGTKVWAAGEAAAMHRIRRHLFDERAVPRADTTVRGYWKRRG